MDRSGSWARRTRSGSTRHSEEEEDLAYGDYPPEQVLLGGLPPMRDRIEPGESWPLAAWMDGRHGAVLFVERASPAEVVVLGAEYAAEIEYLLLDPADGWVGVGGGGGDWPNPFDPPRELLDKYRVFATGFSGGGEDICLVGGLCCDAVWAIEIRDKSGVKVVDVDPDRHTFLVGSRSRPGHIRFLGHNGQPILGHDGATLKLTLEV